MPSILQAISAIFDELRKARPIFVEFLKCCDEMQYQTKLISAYVKNIANIVFAVSKMQVASDIGKSYTEFAQMLSGIGEEYNITVCLLYI